jgi:hypothetical protein
MSSEEKLEIIKSLFWDYDVNPEEALPVLEGKSERIGSISKHELFIKILNFVPWHTIREIFPERMLPQLLSDQVINGLFPPILRERYQYVRKLL